MIATGIGRSSLQPWQGTACEVKLLADSEVEEAKGVNAIYICEVSAPELTVAAAANTAPLSQAKKYCTWPEVLVPLLG